MQRAIRLIYPPLCLGCGAEVTTEFALCGPCWRDADFIVGALCDLCGAPLPGAAEGGAAGARLRCDACLTLPRPWARGRAALLYRGTGRRLVLGLKHGDRDDVARPAGRWLAAAAAPLIAAKTLAVPVPLHPRRLLRRRYNQSALLARALAEHAGCGHCPDALVRPRATPPLDGAGREARFAALAGAIAAHPRRGARLAGRPVLIVDDVMTSGATLAAAAEAAHAAGAASVCVAVLARAAKDT
ncbi:double zinc ribbon domain-containing protein [Roseivivax sp. CAU 1761]